jgi:hypothetical protein
MPYDEAERNMRLFAKEVMPQLQKLGPPPPPVTSAREAPPKVDVGMLAT